MDADFRPLMLLLPSESIWIDATAADVAALLLLLLLLLIDPLWLLLLLLLLLMLLIRNYADLIDRRSGSLMQLISSLLSVPANAKRIGVPPLLRTASATRLQHCVIAALVVAIACFSVCP